MTVKFWQRLFLSLGMVLVAYAFFLLTQIDNLLSQIAYNFDNAQYDSFEEHAQQPTIIDKDGCLSPLPIHINKTSRVVDPPTWLRPPSTDQYHRHPCGRLRRAWKDRSWHSPLAQRMHQHQSNCSLPVMTYTMDNKYGMGSHLHVWSQALCNAWEQGYRLRTVRPLWLWLDRTHCVSSGHSKKDNDDHKDNYDTSSPWNCYFGPVEPTCHEDRTATDTIEVGDPRVPKLRCTWMQQEGFLQAYRTAAMEYFFHHITDLVIAEAQRQLGLVFNDTHVPPDLITVHIRWGDKFWEMDLPPIQEYIDAVEQLASSLPSTSHVGVHDHTTNTDTPLHVYVATEDPKAAHAFQQAAPSHWKVYYDRTLEEMGDFRPAKGNRASWTTRNTKGRSGLVALGSLLVALEANYFVLTTASNWSRLMNELRQAIIDPECDNCTRIIDLRPGEW
jgi:hypothetical protein